MPEKIIKNGRILVSIGIEMLISVNDCRSLISLFFLLFLTNKKLLNKCYFNFCILWRALENVPTLLFLNHSCLS